ncbi:aldo/keto reductase [Lentisphaera profundi]|uniref:Aldo/keto reductase n=1 Tax=Lentisphaera profundi TaxID=1658616 RepID=A0ABY7W1G4_9BACT|nr:aldo/keto reductase [Lentisphaera profundi]WDE98113.1 aldo/keto reductase [Lentisphaera profundi]
MNVPTRRFGRTEIQIPIFSCGGMRYQQSWERNDQKKVEDDNQTNLENTLLRSLELGINHIETAHGYGTSEYQIGKLLPKLDRNSYILQSKIQPHADVNDFQKDFEDSMSCLQVDHLDLMGIHGINNQERLDWTLRKGGCLDRAKEWKKQGRVKHIGFSTHGSPDIIIQAIESGEFDYVNLHWYYFMQKNHPAVEAAKKHDMGVFIISPSDKGGKLYEPPPILSDLCAPLSPMMFNDLFCLQNPLVHTISLGAARPSDFDEHLKIIPHLEDRTTVADIANKIDSRLKEFHGVQWMAEWDQNLPDTLKTPGQINTYDILRFYNLGTALDMTAYGIMRYALLGQKDHWFPGEKANDIPEKDLLLSLTHHHNPKKLIESLKIAHQMFEVKN